MGCGRISHNHINAIASHHNRAELVAICDPQQDRLVQALQRVREATQEFSDEAPSPDSFSSYSDLLAEISSGSISVDLIVLATPSGLHSSQAIAAAEIGVHVCTEKPMATNLDDGIAIVKACDEAMLTSCCQAKGLIQLCSLSKNKLSLDAGKLALVTVNVFWQRPQSYYDNDNWRGTWKLDGGALMNQASHYVDLLDWLIGPVESLSASIATIGRCIEAEDTAALQLRWRSGALGTMAVTMLTYPKNLEGSITILGDRDRKDWRSSS